MATKKAAPKKSKPVSKGQATAVANFLKNGGKTTMGPALPTPKTNPVTTDDDGDESQGA